MPIQPKGLSPEVLKAALEGLEAQRQRIEQHIESVRSRLGQRGPGRPPKSIPPHATSTTAQAGRKRRKMSAAARKRIAEAQRKRWAAVRKANESAAPVKKKAAEKKTGA